MKKGLLWLAFFALGVSARALEPQLDPSIESKVDKLLSKMTLEEKIGQLNQEPCCWVDPADDVAAGRVGSLLNVTGAETANKYQKMAVEKTRLHIPMILGYDVIHGYKTIYPIGLGEAASFDPDLARADAAMAASEAMAAGIRWTFAPMVDIARDPRWGRISEGAGEDPCLGSAMAAARVAGFQSSGRFAACAKHFVGYGAAEAGREYNYTEISPVTLREVYLPPFQAAVDAGVLTLMSAFNDLDGVPASANHFTLSDVLRKEWGFKGFVVSDWDSIGELVKHGLAVDSFDAAAKGLSAGVDMDMDSRAFTNGIPVALKDGRLDRGELDQAVRRVLRVKYKIGLFDQPYAGEKEEQAAMLTPANRAQALKAAEESIVLLKNEGAVLPLRPGSFKTLALVGPLAASQADPLGSWSAQGKADSVVSLRQALEEKAAAGGFKLLYARGCGISDDSRAGIPEAVAAARKADVVVAALGESQDMSGEAASRTRLDIPGGQLELLRALARTNKPIVIVLMNGRPLVLGDAAGLAPAMLDTWFLGVEAGHAIAATLLGENNPAGRLPVSFPRSVGQIPIYYAHRNTGRPGEDKKHYSSKYLDEENSPLFPFGWGLSYTHFEYSGLRVSPTVMSKDGSLQAEVTVRNTGNLDGDEVAQLYIHQLAGSRTRPVKELKGFQRFRLAKGESRTLHFDLPAADLAFYNPDMKRGVEPGDFKLWIGPNSDEGLQGGFRIRP